MTFSVKNLPDKPVIILTFQRHYNFEKDAPEAHAQVAELLDKIGDRAAYLVTDYRAIDMSFSKLVVALGKASRGEPGSASDPRIRQNVFVGAGEMIDMAAESLLQTQYGKLPVIVFPELDEALEYLQVLTGSPDVKPEQETSHKENL